MSAAAEPPPSQPAEGDFEKAAKVAAAGGEAASGEPTVGEAQEAAEREIKRTAKEVKLELGDEDAANIAKMVVQELDARGAFEPAPAAPAPAPPAPAPAPVPAAPEGGAPAVPGPGPEEPPEPPRKRTWAERFAGIE